MAPDGVRVEVVDDDALRAERWTRDLKRSLDTAEGFLVAYGETAGPVQDGTKGPVLHEVLEVSAVWAWPLAAPALVEVLKRWLGRERRARVRVTVGWDHVEIEGEPTPGQERVLLELLDKRPER